MRTFALRTDPIKKVHRRSYKHPRPLKIWTTRPITIKKPKPPKTIAISTMIVIRALITSKIIIVVLLMPQPALRLNRFQSIGTIIVPQLFTSRPVVLFQRQPGCQPHVSACSQRAEACACARSPIFCHSSLPISLGDG